MGFWTMPFPIFLALHIANWEASGSTVGGWVGSIVGGGRDHCGEHCGEHRGEHCWGMGVGRWGAWWGALRVFRHRHRHKLYSYIAFYMILISDNSILQEGKVCITAMDLDSIVDARKA